MEPWLIVTLSIVLIFLILCSAIFSASETAYTAINPGKIETMMDNKEFGAKVIKKQHRYFNQTLGTILICNNIVNIAASSLLSYLLSSTIGKTHGLEGTNVIISTAIMTPIIVIFGEIIPKLLAKTYPIKFAKTFCYVLLALYYIFWPITYPIGKIGKKIYITNSEEDVKNLIDIAQNEGVLETNESIMAQNALDFDTTQVRKHYIKLKDVSYLDANTSIPDAMSKFKETNYSRLPIIKDGHFIGIVHLKDIFYHSNGTVLKYLKVVPYMSLNTTLAKALEKMRRSGAQMAFVTPKNTVNDVVGIITIEDIVEEVVGEIYDEYDQEEMQDIFEISLDLFHVSGNAKMREIIKQTGMEIDIEPSEWKMNLKSWLEKRTKHRLKKTTKYVVEKQDVTFKVLSLADKKYKTCRIEIELGNRAGLIDNIVEDNIIQGKVDLLENSKETKQS